MPSFIADLQREHQAILDFFQDLELLQEGTPEYREKFNALGRLLHVHLSKEDAKLYTIFKNALRADPILAHQIDLYIIEMESITGVVLNFMEKYLDDPNETLFSYGEICDLLADRIWREENLLFPEFEKLFPEASSS